MLNKVIVIEDDVALRRSIEQTLELADLEPIPTNGFTQARRSIRSNFRGVVLSDIQMPGQDGFDVLRFCQAKDPDLPVVLITGHSDVPTAMRAVKEGAYDYLEKPCDPDRLVDVLTRALEHRALVLENRSMRTELECKDKHPLQGTLAEQLEKSERQIIAQALKEAEGKVSIAAQHLGIPRNTLYDRMSKLNLVAKDFRTPDMPP
jgi:DNA-binding NtrC family response regulator